MKTQVGETCSFVRVQFDATWNTRQAKKRKAQATPGVYGLVDPREPNRVRYVGTSHCIETRLYAHVIGDPTHSHPRGVWLRALKAEGVVPQAIVLEKCDVGATGSLPRHTVEAEWIARLKAQGCADLNVHLLPGRPRARALQEENAALRAEVTRLRAELEALRQVGDLV